jgi:hypothetical protein
MFLDTRLGNTPRWFFNRPRDWAMRVPDISRKNTVFLGRVIQKGREESLEFGGTGFLVSVNSVRPCHFYLFLVTAKHVAEELARGDWVMRVNTKDGGFKDIRGTKDHKWWFHPSEEDRTDVAVTWAELPDGADISVLPETLFVSDLLMSEGIGPGDEVYIVGLFRRMQGRSRNLPLVRIGNIAMIPDAGELVPGVKIGKDRVVNAEAYLIEVRSIGGLSGSPVFARMTVEKEVDIESPDMTETGPVLATGPTFLLGLMNGHWATDPVNKNDPNPPMISQYRPEAVNLGLAIVIPAKKILETLYHPELVAQRQQSDAAWQAEEGTTSLD